MKPNRRRQAELLDASLELSLPPVAVSFVDALPDGIALYEGSVPAGACSGRRRHAYVRHVGRTPCAVPDRHPHHDLSEAPASQPGELQAALQAMTGLTTCATKRSPRSRSFGARVNHAVYGPLADFPADPDVIVLFADSRQGLVLSEALARVDGGVPPAMGRPACAALPQAFNRGIAAMSLGCCGARAYLDALSDDTALWTLPGSRLDLYCEQIGTFAEGEPHPGDVSRSPQGGRRGGIAADGAGIPAAARVKGGASRRNMPSFIRTTSAVSTRSAAASAASRCTSSSRWRRSCSGRRCRRPSSCRLCGRSRWRSSRWSPTTSWAALLHAARQPRAHGSRLRRLVAAHPHLGGRVHHRFPARVPGAAALRRLLQHALRAGVRRAQLLLVAPVHGADQDRGLRRHPADASPAFAVLFRDVAKLRGRSCRWATR